MRSKLVLFESCLTGQYLSEGPHMLSDCTGNNPCADFKLTSVQRSPVGVETTNCMSPPAQMLQPWVVLQNSAPDGDRACHGLMLR
jgi:hypothetical protein